jgi:hypothetical protein
MPNCLYSIVFCHRGTPPAQPRPSLRWEGGGLCHNYFPVGFRQFFRVRIFSVTRLALTVWTVTLAAWSTQMLSQRCDRPTNVSVSGSWQRCHRCPRRDLRPRHGGTPKSGHHVGRLRPGTPAEAQATTAPLSHRLPPPTDLAESGSVRRPRQGSPAPSRPIRSGPALLLGEHQGGPGRLQFGDLGVKRIIGEAPKAELTAEAQI